MHLIWLILIVVVAFIVGRWLLKTPPAQAAQALRRALLYGAILILIFLAVTGRLHWLFALLGGAVPVVMNLVGIWRRWRLARQAGGDRTAGRQSTVETRYVHMTLDHDSGDVGGVVTEGQFKDRRLEELREHELMQLLRECRTHDTESANLLEAYLDRRFGDEWRGQSESDAGGGAHQGQHNGGAMGREEALRILGLDENAGEEDIRSAHRRLMQKLHPDHGGSDYLAAKINEAKSVLLAS